MSRAVFKIEMCRNFASTVAIYKHILNQQPKHKQAQEDTKKILINHLAQTHQLENIEKSPFAW